MSNNTKTVGGESVRTGLTLVQQIMRAMGSKGGKISGKRRLKTITHLLEKVTTVPYRAPRQISEAQKERLRNAFLNGKSKREAARVAGVSPGAAQRFRLTMGGVAGLKEQGVRFKQNRWR